MKRASASKYRLAKFFGLFFSQAAANLGSMDAPTIFRAGDSVNWTFAHPDYPAGNGWSIKYRLVYPTGAAKEFQATAEGDGFVIAVSSSDTEDWPSGLATLVCVAENSGARKTISAISVTVLPNLATVGTFDGRSLNKRTLDDLEKTMAAYAADEQGHVEEYEIAGRRMKFRSIDEIQKLISRYTILVAKENIVASLLNGGEPPGRCYYRG